MDMVKRRRMIAQAVVAMDAHWQRATDAKTLAQAQVVDADGQHDEYEHKTLGELRARLRTLTPEQLRQVHAYEAAHANREPVLVMLQHRIARLEQDAAQAESGTADTEVEQEFERLVQAFADTNVG